MSLPASPPLATGRLAAARVLLGRLWQDERGFTISTELVFVATLTVIGLIVGLATYRDSVVQELGDAASAIAELNQSYEYNRFTRTTTFGTVTVSVRVEGSVYNDNSDFCEVTPDPVGQPPACIAFTAATNEGT